MANPPNVAVSFVRLKCNEQEDTELPIVDNEDDEPYVVALSIDVGDRILDGVLSGAAPPAFQVFRVGPMADIDEGDLKPAPANQLWNLDGNPAPMPNPGRTLFGIALLENDNADPGQVVNQARTLLQGTLIGAWNNARNRTDLDEPARFEFYAGSVRTAFESAIDTARGFSPPGAVLDPDDKLGAPQLLRFSPDEHRQVLAHAPSTIERTLHFEGDDANYDLTFSLHHPGPAGWRTPFPIAEAGWASPGAIAAVARQQEQLDVFWVGSDANVTTTFWNPASGWARPFPIAEAGWASRGAVAALARQPEQLDVFWIGSDANVTTTFWNPASGWARPFPIAEAGWASPGAIAAVSRQPEQLDVFWIGSDGNVTTTFWNPASGWARPFPIAEAGWASPGAIAAVPSGPEQLDVFWIGSDGNVTTTFWNPASGWVRPFPIADAGWASRGAVAALARRPEQRDVFWVGSDANVTTTFWTP